MVGSGSCFPELISRPLPLRPILRPFDTAFVAARRHIGRAGGLNFDHVTPQWPASFEPGTPKKSTNGRQISPNAWSLTPYCLGGDVCIDLVRDSGTPGLCT